MIIDRRTPASPIGDRWAIVVGISKYRHESLDLAYADRDAREFRALIQSPQGGGFKSENVVFLVNEEATTPNVTRALRTFLKKPDRHDLVVIYFACHGAPDPERPGNVYLLTHDVDPTDLAGTAVPMREIDLSLRENLLAERVVIIADTCHSAAIGGGPGTRGVVNSAAAVNAYLRELSATRPGVALLTSAEANEASFEGVKWGGGHGVFTHYLLEGMRGAADCTPRSGVVTVGELFEYVRENVKIATDHRQHPAIGTTLFDRNLPMALPGLGEVSIAPGDDTSGGITTGTEAAVVARDGGRDTADLTRMASGRPALTFRITAAVAIGLTFVAVLVYGPWRNRQQRTASRGGHPVVEVLPFVSVGAGANEQLGPWMQQELAGTLADSGWHVVSRGVIAARDAERSLAASGDVNPASAISNDGPRPAYVVTGSQGMVASDTIAVEAYVIDIASGRVLASRAVRSTLPRLREGMRDLSIDVLRATPSFAETASSSGASVRRDAVSNFAAAIVRLTRNQVDIARTSFSKAVAEDSTYGPATVAARALSTFPKDSRPAVAILPFYNAGMPIPGDLAEGFARLERELPAMLMPELLASGAMVVERDPKMLQEIVRESRGGDSARKLGADSVRRGRMIGAHYMIAGSFMLLGREWILDVQINDLASGLVRERMTTRVPADSLLDAMSSLGVRVAAGVSRLPPVAPRAALDSLASLRARLGIPDRTPGVRR